mmetsp:Transcript_44056/g.71731  ORF Transcript_44056/g.71731 Transcript_44056/m.71731 type:complete len:134 (+) Transcript_44056:285-686(+)
MQTWQRTLSELPKTLFTTVSVGQSKENDPPPEPPCSPSTYAFGGRVSGVLIAGSFNGPGAPGKNKTSLPQSGSTKPFIECASEAIFPCADEMQDRPTRSKQLNNARSIFAKLGWASIKEWNATQSARKYDIAS